MRIVVTGANGRLGKSLVQLLAPQAEVIGLTRAAADVAEPAVIDRIADLRPDVVVHAAAMTDVDGCARDPAAAWRVNATGTRHVALACRQVGAYLVYISTNEVFDGRAARPYREDDPPNPINPYGASKLAGEHAVQELVDRFAIVRTAWLYGGGRDFVAKILQRAAEQPELRVVDDEIGSPTYVGDLAWALAALIDRGGQGIFHFVNAGACSRYAFAREILQLAGRPDVSVRPIRSSEYQRASTPPAYSPLENVRGAALGIVLRPWRAALRAYLTA